jgi:hypothetical protein
LGSGNWVDLSGLICPFEALDNLLKSIESATITSLDEVNSALTSLHKNYYNYEWSWVYDVLETFYGKRIGEFTAQDVIVIVKKWKKCVLQIDTYLYEDASKEFSLAKMTGFGVDGQKGTRKMDFDQVRGELSENETVKTIKAHMKAKEILGNEVIERMNRTIENMPSLNL